MATPLPKKDSPPGLESLAYQKCLDLESLALADSSLQREFPPGVVAARLLGHLLLLVPNATGRAKLAEEICSTSHHTGLISIAQFYINTFINAFKHSGTPDPSNHSSRASFEEEPQCWVDLSEPSKLDHYTAKQAALKRDGYRCALTGHCDDQSRQAGLIRLQDGEKDRYTEAAHIIPEATNHSIDKDAPVAHQSEKVWAVLSGFSSIPADLQEELNGNRIHRLQNVITMETHSHRAFDDLRIWFKFQPGSISTYTVHTPTDVHRFMGAQLPTTITFNATDPQLPPPSRNYLELHALCCEVAMLSGAGEYVNWVQDQFEETQVLAGDGSSAQLFSFALSAALVH